MIRVVFTYCEITRLWESTVEGATDNTEARQAFNAVELTVQELDPKLLTHTRALTAGDKHVIVPAV